MIDIIFFGFFCFALGYDLSRLQKKHILQQTNLLTSMKDEIKKFISEENKLMKDEIKNLK